MYHFHIKQNLIFFLNFFSASLRYNGQICKVYYITSLQVYIVMIWYTYSLWKDSFHLLRKLDIPSITFLMKRPIQHLTNIHWALQCILHFHEYKEQHCLYNLVGDIIQMTSNIETQNVMGPHKKENYSFIFC